MWRLWHKLFGWDYALIPFAGNYEIVRVQKAPFGRFGKICGWIYLDNNKHREWIPLTYED